MLQLCLLAGPALTCSCFNTSAAGELRAQTQQTRQDHTAPDPHMTTPRGMALDATIFNQGTLLLHLESVSHLSRH